MTVKVSVKADIKAVTRYLSSAQKRQLPFATKNALDGIAFLARKELRKQIVKKIDRPKPFTVNSFLVKKSKKTDLKSTVFIRDTVWDYFKYQIAGGTRKPSARLLPIPVNAPLNDFGNIKGRKRGPKGKRQFVANIRGTVGVWERYNNGRRVRLMVFYHTSAKYDRKFQYQRIVEAIVAAKFTPIFNKQLRRALLTAR
jgi:hypothetical protein